MSDANFCRNDHPHKPDHIPTLIGEKGYCKVCLEYDYVAEVVAFPGVLGPRWTPSAASEIEARKRLAGQLPTARAAPQPAPGSEQNVMRLIQAIGDDTTLQIDTIARRNDLSGEDKMRAIVGLDSRFIGKDSNEWGTLLGVTPDCVRGYAFWKELRKRKKSLD